MPCSGAFSRAAPAATCGRTRRHLRAHPPRSTSGFLGSAGRPGHTPSLPRPRSSRAGLHRAFTLTRPLPQRQRRRLLATRSVTASHRVLRHLATRAPLPFHPQRRPLPLPAPRRPTQILDAEPPSSSAVPRSHILRIAHSRIRLLGAEAHGDASGSASGGAEANGDANDSGAKAAAAESEESESEDADAAKQECVVSHLTLAQAEESSGRESGPRRPGGRDLVLARRGWRECPCPSKNRRGRAST
ncbi:uncharacterized protein LOC8075490 isoform X4 [Sorghum bicolor]|uniref:uncharacterized protein LOC8075490 isoform X4 n=1 Tax=Sorghum bicolor TaxID=4558 RepID=UPI000B423790|nr:uncharacterized protein LOC8075490 isoform X4 [Sorghum bicolor]|eukprot:XP_021311166.1 uncharacterized protein LOC8075490 isoform X4 [Sorghum bicolor]